MGKELVDKAKELLRDRAQVVASEAAAWWAEHVLQAYEPVTLLAALVAQKPHTFVQCFNDSVAHTTQHAVQGNNNQSRFELQLLPNGVVQSARPAAGNTGAGLGFVILQPVFVTAAASSSPGVGAGGAVVNALCGAPCARNASSSELQWWGFVAAEVDISAFATAPGSPLVLLEHLGYRYQVVVVGGSSSGSSSGSGSSGGAAVETPVESSAVLPSNDYKEGRAELEPGPQPLTLAVRTSPAAGWAGDDAHTYAVSMLAVLCGMGLIAASLLFGALVSWRRNKMLLETLLPKAVLKDLRGEDTSVLGVAQMRPTDTPADTLLAILADLLEGVTPDLRDVVLVRTALQRNWDVYTPLNLRGHIKGANLDADVAQALMQQLMGSDSGGTPYDSMYGNGGNGTGHGMRGYSTAGGGYSASLSGMGQGSGGLVRRISGFVTYNLDTMAGALQFILSPDAIFSDSVPSGTLAHPLGAAAAAPAAAGMVIGGGDGGGGGGGGSLLSMPGSLYDAAAAIPEGSSVSLAEGGAVGVSGGRCTVSGALHTIPSGVVVSLAGPSGRAQSLPQTAGAAASLQQGAHTASGGATGTSGAAAAVTGMPPQSSAAGSSPLVPLTAAIYRSYTISGVPENPADDAEGSSEESGLYGPYDEADLVGLEAGGTGGGGAPVACRGRGGAGEGTHGNPRLTRTTEAAHLATHPYQHHHSQQHAQHRPGSMILTSTGTGSLLLTVRATDEGAAAAAAGAGAGAGNTSAAGTPRPDAGKRSSAAAYKQRRPPGRAASFGLPDSPTQLASLAGAAAAASRVQLCARGGRRSVELPSSTATGAFGTASVGDGAVAEDSASLQSYAMALLHKPASRLGLLHHLQSGAPASATALSQPSSQQLQLNTSAAAAAAAGTGSPSLAQLAQAQHAQHALSRQRKAASHDRLSSSSLPHRLDLSPFLTAEATDAATAGAGSNGAAAIAPCQVLASPPPFTPQTLPLPQQPCIPEVERLLAKSDSWEFDMWALQEATQGHALSVLGFYLMRRTGLMDRFKLKPVKIARLLRAIENGYVDNPYHSAIHAADVLQTLHVVIHAAQLHVHYLDALGLLASYYAAIVHDFAHPGLTGDFLVASSDPLAIRYNDRSPLENHHCAASFALLRRKELDALSPLSQSERSAFRKQVIELVLSTDMKQHFSILSHFNTVHRLAAYSGQAQQADSPHGQQHPSPKPPPPIGGKAGAHKPGQLQSYASVDESLVVLQLSEGSLLTQADAAASAAAAGAPAPRPVDDTERLLTLQIALKCADIGHLGESLEVHKKWLSNLEEEFFRQGDRERALGLPISPLFDRSKQGVSKSQVGFYDFVALPLVHALSSAFPGTQQLMRCFLQNYHYWKEAAEMPDGMRRGND
ncbi:hypothetical protein HXX76_013451 [Chlamydomonas incerta]|uniref:PDEase domain-containing protein n=1 Tax=Chlamydomonas incerta TaxID=51695 RepID=A0A835STZ9_CHLIN|nr:hypothetical protein HXX76_013451 [Chlamydomonas incerta]|eukprot:KAG2425826.1 hypothetical protein HXX76_013451 [Chlamydomonas incerta]